MSAADRLAQIRARAEAATPGPWEAVTSEIRGHVGYSIKNAAGAVVLFGGFGPRGGPQELDAVLAAHARTDIPALLAAVEAVLALHSPRAEAVLSDPDCLREECDHEGACPLGGSVTVCAACWIVAEESYHYFCEQGIPDEVLHPCDTVRAITEALA